jgi:hypothetical protein
LRAFRLEKVNINQALREGKKKALMEAVCFVKNQDKQKWLEVPTVASIEVLFEEYNITPAAYHGGKLNGVDCREVIGKA